MAILFYKTAFISANNPIGQRNHSWLKVFNVLIHEIFRNLTKVAKRENRYILKILSFLVDNCAFFFHYKTSFISLKKPSLFPTERLQHSEPPSFSKSTQKLHKVFKILFFFGIFVNFGLNLMHFFNTNCFYLFAEASRTTNLFLV